MVLASLSQRDLAKQQLQAEKAAEKQKQKAIEKAAEKAAEKAKADALAAATMVPATSSMAASNRSQPSLAAQFAGVTGHGAKRGAASVPLVVATAPKAPKTAATTTVAPTTAATTTAPTAKYTIDHEGSISQYLFRSGVKKGDPAFEKAKAPSIHQAAPPLSHGDMERRRRCPMVDIVL